MINTCPICGGDSFIQHEILCDQLISDWELSDSEVKYINEQQAYCCTQCHFNLRSMALAASLMRIYDFSGLFTEFVNRHEYQNLRILEINEACYLNKMLKNMKKHTFTEYPECDMQNMYNFKNDYFDIVIHSDTLEHVLAPVEALKECYRILKINGSCLFTVPIIVDRMSRTRLNMSKSFHGDYSQMAEDFVVHTEFGADAWKYLVEAGFDKVNIHTYNYPAGIVLEGIKVK